MKLLTYADVEDIDTKANWLPIDYLAAVAERATTLYDQEKQEERAMEKMNKNPLFDMSEASLSKPRNTFKKPTPIFCPSLDLFKQKELIRERSLKKLVVTFSKDKDFIPHEEVLKKEKMLRETHRETSRASSRMGSKRNRSESDDSVEHSRVIKKKKGNGRNKLDDNGPNPPPPLPEAYKERIRELTGKSVSDEKLVIQKKLFETDVSKGHNRLSIPFKKIKEEFLNEDEAYTLSLHKGKNMESMEVPLIDPLHGIWEVSLRRWDMKKDDMKKTSTSYVLSRTWNRIKEENCLKSEMVVQLWSFRLDGELWFALVKEPQDQSGKPSGSGNMASCSSSSSVAKASSSSPPDHD